MNYFHKFYSTHLKIIVFVFCILPLFISCSSSKETTNNELDEISISKAERTILELVNKYRKKKDLPKLKSIDEIVEIAEEHSKNMGEGKVKVGHDGFDKRYKKVKKKVKNVGSAAENVAFGNTSLKKIVDGWLKSPHHLSNIEGPFNYTGVGIYRNKQGVLFYTQIFINKVK
jgi:uncharacterized protein YkwD